MADDPRYLVWMDLETTGTDERRDPILEVGMIVTTTDLADEVATWSDPVFPADYAPTDRPWWQDDNWLTALMPPEVVSMHRSSGLLADIMRCDKHYHRLSADLFTIEQHLTYVLDGLGKPGEFMLAGSGVSHFDRRFIKAQMPEFEKWLQYPNADVGVFRRMLRMLGREDLVRPAPQAEDKTHRALADARFHLEEARYYKRALAGV